MARAARAAENTQQAQEPDHTLLDRAFPRHRILWSRFRWQYLWVVPYIPFGVAAILIRILCLMVYLSCVVLNIWPRKYQDLWYYSNAFTLAFRKVRIVKDDVHREEYAAQHFEWVSQQQLGQHLSATAGRTIILGDHHALYMDGLNLHCCIRDAIRSTGTSAGAITVVGRGTADDPLFSRACNPKQHLMMHKGRKLSGIVKAWRDINSKYRPRPLIVYPQGTVCATDVVMEVQPRIFELLQGDEVIRPVAVDIISPLPFINLRGLGASNISDILYFMFQPFWVVVITVLPPLPADVAANPKQAAKAVQQALAQHGTIAKQALPVSLFDKKAWERIAYPRAFPGYRAAETAVMIRLQQLWPAALQWLAIVLHYATMEATLVSIGAVFALCGLGSDSISLLFGPLGRALALNTCLVHWTKLTFRVPRPTWVHGSSLPIVPAKLKPKMTQTEFALPSGHAAFMGCLWGAIAALASKPGVAALTAVFGLSCSTAPGSSFLAPVLDLLCQPDAGLPIWAHAVFAVLTLSAALARVYLSLHWPSDVLVGAPLGGLVGYGYIIWADPLFMGLSAAMQLKTAMYIAGGFALLCTTALLDYPRTNYDKLACGIWSKTAGFVVDPFKPKVWLTVAGIFAGVWSGAPMASWMTMTHAETHVMMSKAADLGIESKAVGAAAGVLTIAAGVFMFMSLPSQLLSSMLSWVKAAQSTSESKQAVLSHTALVLQLLSYVRYSVGAFCILQTILYAAHYITPGVAIVFSEFIKTVI